MRALMFWRKPADEAALDPAPSRWAWRFERLLLTPGFLFFLRAGVPFALTLSLGFWWFSVPENRLKIEEAVIDVRASVAERPEFMVHGMAIDGAVDEVARAIRDAVALDFPMSSFDLDLALVRSAIEEMDPVSEAALRIKPGGVLHVSVVPRVPAVIWRSSAGLTLLDRDGERVADIPWRGARADLPVIAGEGAPDFVPEALALIAAAQPLRDRMHGLVRVGERRWDLVLDRDQRVLLPSEDPQRALDRVLALHKAQDVLSRDVATVDMRLGERSTVRMVPRAQDEWRRIRQINLQNE
ncbi:MAG: cell division protein FtsQ [Rhodobacteraceae bacterium]|nr:cell division protein FtsQ [Paracoccaceae bacterium]